MINKQKARIRRSGRTRAKARQLNTHRLCIYRSSNNIYAQLISKCNKKVLASASTLEEAIKEKLKHGGNKKAASLVGATIAERVIKLGISDVMFDRSGYRYHGRVAALADAAREAGLKF